MTTTGPTRQCARCDGMWKPLSPMNIDELLPTATVARVVGHDHTGPTIELVRFVMVGPRIYFYADGRSLFAETSVDTSIMLEVDNIGLTEDEGWMVVVRGRAHPLGDRVTHPLVDRLPEPIVRGLPLCRLIEVTATSITGSRLCPRSQDTPCARNDTAQEGRGSELWRTS
ncbi:pyridoxamine 5'-phosphate oxidase family protein [Rhodococcoides yunnanense]|uniref:pyridoxamine 5'-phosphate oxidase family protein n=1 Tax=Rhodococcoides yunnanense TaxID=278209 RepID=UPI0009355BCA|nr:pyridoxamine 5'-phosphate oxidase family protein [Rhodococcus yunnanensis]